MPRPLAFMLVATLLSLCPAALAEQVDNPEYKHWSSFKPGATADYKMAMTKEGQQMEMSARVELKSLDENVAMVERTMSMVMNGQSMPMPSQEDAVLAKIDASEVDPIVAAMHDPQTEHGQETLTIAGQKLECTWYQIDTPDMKGKVWTCPKVPGHLVRMQGATEEGGAATLELQAFHAG